MLNSPCQYFRDIYREQCEEYPYQFLEFGHQLGFVAKIILSCF